MRESLPLRLLFVAVALAAWLVKAPLAGIQFVLGDIEVDITPSAQIAGKTAAAKQHRDEPKRYCEPAEL